VNADDTQADLQTIAQLGIDGLTKMLIPNKTLMGIAINVTSSLRFGEVNPALPQL
jgi:hypothetical protein